MIFYYPGKQSFILLHHVQLWVHARLHNVPTLCTSKEVVSFDTFYPLNTFFTMSSKHDVPHEIIIHENSWRHHTEVNNISMSYALSFSDLLCNKTFLIFTLFYIANDEKNCYAKDRWLKNSDTYISMSQKLQLIVLIAR